MEHHANDRAKQHWLPDHSGMSDLFMLNCYDIWSATPTPRECFESHGDQDGRGACTPAQQTNQSI